MMKRLFIAVDLPEEAKRVIDWEIQKIKKFFPERLRIMPKEDWHITITFLGEQDEEKLPVIKEAIQKAVNGVSGAEIYLRKIHFGPTPENPRMLWVFGESPELSELKRKIDKSLEKAEIEFQKSDHELSVHITLARMIEELYFHMPPHSIGESFKASSVHLVESVLQKPRAIYTILETFSLTDSE